MDNLERTNRALFGYLEHGRLPQKGLLKKRQFTWDEMVSYAKERYGKTLPYNETLFPEYLNIYLRLRFSVDGWWRNREVMLLLSGKSEEVKTLNAWFRQRTFRSVQHS